MPEQKRSQPDIPSENGKRASIDSSTGEVHGARRWRWRWQREGEDFDSDSAAGSGAAPSTPPAPD